MVTLNKQQVQDILNDLLTAAREEDAIEPGDEEFLTQAVSNLTPDMRDKIIEYRNAALSAANFNWVVELSHVVYAMSEPAFFEGENVQLSTT